MSTLSGILAIYGIVVLLTILGQVLAAAQRLGIPTLAGNRDGLAQLDGIAGRFDRAQMNSIIALALFAPAALLHIAGGTATGSVVLAGQIFLLARIAYVIVYVAGIPWLRTVCWLAAYAAIFLIYLQAL